MRPKYEAYSGAPIILDCSVITEEEALLRVEKEFNKKPFKVIDLLESTINELKTDLTDGTALKKHLLEIEKTVSGAWGTWVYYPNKNHLVRYAPSFWHRLALIARNSFLLRDPQMKLSWHQIRGKFENSVIAFAGCSVGSSIIYATVKDMRPQRIKVADPKSYSVTNANRAILSYEDFGKNKAEIVAEKLHAIDPFMNVSVYNEGVNEENIHDFLGGNPELSEPRADILVEEVDNPEAKIRLREIARQYKIPVVMASDLGSGVQIDIRRFDLCNTISLMPFVADEQLYSALKDWKNDPTNKQKLFKFYYSMIGNRSDEKLPEFNLVAWQKIPLLFSGVPQLGSTVMTAAGLMAETVARILLGWDFPERRFLAKHTLETFQEKEVNR